MSDFLVWLSPMPIPPGIRSGWQWPTDQPVGVRRSDHTDLGWSRLDGQTAVLVGRGLGRRNHRRFEPPDSLARQYLVAFRRRGIEALDERLGPVAGVHLADDGSRITVWRDRFGRHPIQMVRLTSGWAVTTSPRAVAGLAGDNPRATHLASFVHAATSTTDADALDDVYRIRPAEWVRFVDRRITQRHRWWNPSRRTVDAPHRTMRRILDDIGDLYGSHPHVLALSSGLDSATLAAVASRRHPESRAATFTAPSSSQNEGPEAARTARFVDLDWRPFRIDEHWPLRRLDDHRFPTAWGPLSHPDVAWKMPFHRWLDDRDCRLPVMYGNGADEVLWVPPGLWLESRWHHRDWSELARARRHLRWHRWLRPALRMLTDPCSSDLLDILRRPSPPSRQPWLRPSTWMRPPPTDARPPSDSDPEQRFFRLRTWRLRTWRWERVMRSLAFEARESRRPVWTPFLDAELWELSLSLNSAQLVEGGRQKSIIRQATTDLLPENCRTRPKVGGFDPVVERGLAEREARLVYRLMADARLDRRADVDASAFLEAYRAYRHRSNTASACRGSWPVWKTVTAELWLRRRITDFESSSSISNNEVQP